MLDCVTPRLAHFRNPARLTPCIQAASPVAPGSSIVRGEEVVLGALNAACHALATHAQAFWMAVRRAAPGKA